MESVLSMSISRIKQARRKLPDKKIPVVFLRQICYNNEENDGHAHGAKPVLSGMCHLTAVSGRITAGMAARKNGFFHYGMTPRASARQKGWNDNAIRPGNKTIPLHWQENRRRRAVRSAHAPCRGSVRERENHRFH